MTQDPRAVAKAVLDSIDKTFGDYYKEVGKIENALIDARRQAFDEVKGIIASHHAPCHWYFEWLIKKIDGRIADHAKASQEEP